MKRYLALSIVFLFLFPACGGSQKKAKSASYRKGTKSQRYYPARDDLSIEDIIYQNLEHRRGTGVHYANYIRQNREFDLPVTRNVYVEKWINYFTGRGRRHFARYLARAGRFIPYIHSVLEQYGLPKDIAYLSMIESGYNIRAKSWASAVGPWQFIRSTGAMYGLDAGYYVDERRDVQKSTHAAARHLRDLYNDFGHWYLAFAAYNAGPGKVRRAIRRNGSNYWDMVKGRVLRQETKDYVPKILAAAIIAKNPSKYGFRNIRYQTAIPYEVVRMKGPTDLEVTAECAGVDPDLIRLLNPELLRDMTPPNVPNYGLKVPQGTKRRFQKKYASLRPSQRVKIHYYVTDRGDTVKSVARRYGVKQKELAKANPGKIKVSNKRYTKKVKVRYRRKGKRRTRWKRKSYTVTSYRVNPGARLTIPKSTGTSYASTRDDVAAYNAEQRFGKKYAAAEPSSKKRKKNKKKKEKKNKKIAAAPAPAVKSDLYPLPSSYTRPRSDLDEIGFIVRDEKSPSGSSPLAFQNRPAGTLAAGRSSGSPTQAELKQAVAKLRPISDEPDLTGDPQVKKWVAASEKPKAQEPVVKKPTYHVVKSGETLKGISRRYAVPMSALKEWNGKKVSPVLLAGAKIKVSGGTRGSSVASAKSPAPAKAKSSNKYYRVRSGDTLSGIARKNKVSRKKLIAWNGKKVSPVLQAGARIQVRGQQVVKYKVKKGDNLHKIAKKHSTTPAKIKKLNGLKSTVIRPGAILIVRRN